MRRCYPFEAEKLPFSPKSLEPYISHTTMQLHHNTLYLEFVSSLNETLEAHPGLQNLTIPQLLFRMDRLCPALRTKIRHNAGGVFAHECFFSGMIPGGSTFSCALEEKILQKFGSFRDFKNQFLEKSLSVFGSGYTWLSKNSSGELFLSTTENQDTPLPKKLTPLINLDLWEHSYYLDRYTDREAYVLNWFRVANFARASKLYESCENDQRTC